jgi:hypothetical protein
MSSRQENPSALERRIAPRRQPTLGTVCHLTTDTGEAQGIGLVWNLSVSGVSMLLNKTFPTGTVLAGRLRTADERGDLPFQMRVAHVARLRTGDWFVGGQFQRPLVPEEMRPFLGEAAPARA